LLYLKSSFLKNKKGDGLKVFFVIINGLLVLAWALIIGLKETKRVSPKIAVVLIVGLSILVAGVILNTVALVSNGGKMPVIGHTTRAADSFHVNNPPRVTFPVLVDRYDGIFGGKKSIGDFLIAGGFTFLGICSILSIKLVGVSLGFAKDLFLGSLWLWLGIFLLLL
jgi:hypothetical protein